MVEIEEEYFSASANRSLNVLDISNDILAFGSSNAVLLYNYKKCQILGKLDKHEDKVNCVKFFDSGNRILSCSGDKNAIIWKRDSKSNIEQYKVEFILTGHKASIDVGCSIVLSDQLLTMTSSNDACLNIFSNEKTIISRQEKHFTFDIKLIMSNAVLFNKKIIAFLASSDSTVHLYEVDPICGDLITIAKLSGHHEWVRSVDSIYENEHTLMIASGAQDNFIRVWRIQERTNNENLNTDLFFELADKSYSIVLDTVMAGHEDKVYGVRWMHRKAFDHPLQLASISMDKSLIIWEQPEKESENLWFEKHRLGEISGNNLGLLSLAISSTNDHIIVSSFNGALHHWQSIENETNISWTPKPIVLGHFRPVTDLHWDIKDNYLLSVSLDATCRLHCARQEKDDKFVWYELARPQVHGYEINCLAIISSTKFVSGADEKVLRVCEATKTFVKSFEQITKIQLFDDVNSNFIETLADFAAVPTLGLSNYAVNECNLEENKTVCKPEIFDQPPKEESLLSNTLWPEVAKIYGHGYEIYTLAVNHRRQHIASACKATNHEDAAVCIWSLETNYSLIQRLIFHKLTVTSMQFSPDGQYLVTASRDRNWALFKFNETTHLYEMVAQSTKEQLMHSRIIWAVCWTPDSRQFMTSSRDKQVIVWQLNHENNHVTPCPRILKLDESAFSIDTTDKHLVSSKSPSYLVALGIENGDFMMTSWSIDAGWIELKLIKQFHTMSIRKVKFNKAGNRVATCGDDGFVRIVKVHL